MLKAFSVLLLLLFILSPQTATRGFQPQTSAKIPPAPEAHRLAGNSINSQSPSHNISEV